MLSYCTRRGRACPAYSESSDPIPARVSGRGVALCALYRVPFVRARAYRIVNLRGGHEGSALRVRMSNRADEVELEAPLSIGLPHVRGAHVERARAGFRE